MSIDKYLKPVQDSYRKHAGDDNMRQTILTFCKIKWLKKM